MTFIKFIREITCETMTVLEGIFGVPCIIDCADTKLQTHFLFTCDLFQFSKIQFMLHACEYYLTPIQK